MGMPRDARGWFDLAAGAREKEIDRLERFALRKASGHARDLVGGTVRGMDAVELERPVVDVIPHDLVALDEGAHVVDEDREVGRLREWHELVEDRHELAHDMRGMRPSLNWVG